MPDPSIVTAIFFLFLLALLGIALASMFLDTKTNPWKLAIISVIQLGLSLTNLIVFFDTHNGFNLFMGVVWVIMTITYLYLAISSSRK